MKKILAVFLSISIFVCLLSVVAYADYTGYEAKAYTDQKVYYYDAANESKYCYINLHLSTPEIEKYETVEYDIKINHNVVKFYSSITVDEGAFKRNIEHTDTGYVYTVSLINGSDIDGITIVFSVAGIGELNFDVTATGYYPDGTHKQLNIDLEKPYDKVVDISEVEFLDKEKYSSRYVPAEHGATAGELVSASGVKTAVVINADGEILENDAAVPNGAYLATMYEGFVVDKVQFCVMEDVNCDGKITAADARLALRHAAKLEQLDGVRFVAADVNKDNKVTAADARLILRKPAGLA